MSRYVMDIFPVLVNTLMDGDERVVMISLQVLVDMSAKFSSDSTKSDSDASLCALLTASVLGLLQNGSISEERFVVVVRYI